MSRLGKTRVFEAVKLTKPLVGFVKRLLYFVGSQCIRCGTEYRSDENENIHIPYERSDDQPMLDGNTIARARRLVRDPSSYHAAIKYFLS